MSEYYQPAPPDKDPYLWRLAQRRAAFRSHFRTYVIINIMLWLIWLLTGSDTSRNGIPWPAWSTAGWGIGLLFHYFGAYSNSGDPVEKEYEKLKNQQQKQP